MASDTVKDKSADGDSPPDLMPAAKRKRLQQCFEKANDLARKAQPDFDYAHDMYGQCVANDPGNLVYAESMLSNLQKKFNNNKKGSRFNFGGRKAFKQAVADEDWPALFREGLEILKANPWDTQALREMARACAFNRYNEVELLYLKNALDGKPKDVEVNRHCAQSLARMGQFDMAISCWNRVFEKNKSDEAESMMSELTLAKTMSKPASLEAIGATGDRPMAPKPSASAAATGEPEAAESAGDVESETGEPDGTGDSTAESGKPKIQLNDRQQLEKSIREDPSKLQNYLDLAAVHSSERRYVEAENVLADAIAAVGSSLKLQTSLEEAQIRSAKAKVAIAEQRAASAKTEEAIELVGQLRSDQNRLELGIYQRRCQRYPDKIRLHYDLGVRLKRAGNYLEAVKSFETARSDPNCRMAATLDMGECWQKLKQYSKAVKCYRAAIEDSSDLDGDRQKLALYRGGVLAAAMKDTDQARDWLQTLVKLDDSYRDAAARLDKLG